MTHANIFKHPIFFAIPVVLAFSIYMASKSSLASGDLFGTDKRMKETAKRIEADRLKQQQSAAITQPSLSVQSQTSSARISAPASPLPPGATAPGGMPLAVPSASPAWYRYDVQGIVRNGLQTLYLVQGHMFRQHECRNYNSSARVIECFGPYLTYSPSPATSISSSKSDDSHDEKKADKEYQPSDVIQVSGSEKIDGQWVRVNKTYIRTPDGFKLIKSEPDKS